MSRQQMTESKKGPDHMRRAMSKAKNNRGPQPNLGFTMKPKAKDPEKPALTVSALIDPFGRRH